MNCLVWKAEYKFKGRTETEYINFEIDEGLFLRLRF